MVNNILLFSHAAITQRKRQTKGRYPADLTTVLLAVVVSRHTLSLAYARPSTTVGVKLSDSGGAASQTDHVATHQAARQSSPTRTTLPSISIFNRWASTLRWAAFRSRGLTCEYNVSISV